MSANFKSGWNRPRESADGEVRSAKKVPRAWCLVLGALILAALGVGAYFMFSGGERPQDAATVKGRGRIKEAKPVTRTDLAKMIEAKTGKTFKAPPPKDPNDFGWYTNKLGEVKRRTGKGGFVIKALPSKSLFTNDAENQLDFVVNTPLGTEFYDDDVPEDFEEQFAYSLTNKISITKDDTPEEAQRKQRVLDAKEELVKAKNEGRNLRELMLETKREMRKQFEDYQFFENGLNELYAAEATPEEIAEYALAAKQMMEAKGLERKLALPLDEQEAMDKLERLITPQKGDDSPTTDAVKETGE